MGFAHFEKSNGNGKSISYVCWTGGQQTWELAVEWMGNANFYIGFDFRLYIVQE